MLFNEDFLHFIWKYRLFNQKNLTSVSGDTIEIVATGHHNKNAGPDFEHVRLKINGTLWVGNVEIHILSSDWTKHNHTADKAYNNVVIHAVYDYDQPVFREDGSEVMTLMLKEHIFPGIELRFGELMESLSWIPCEKQIGKIEEIHLDNWLSRVLIERLEGKSSLVLDELNENRGSWDDTFYIILARNFGFKVNSLPFELLAKSLPQQLLAKHKTSALQIEALIFGQAGFLDHASDEYTTSLHEEYNFLRRKYQLQPVDRYLWKFLRLRPQNFPTIRLAQFAALILKSSHLFSKILDAENVKSIEALFHDLPVNPYWKTHYRFGKEVTEAGFTLGKESVQNILINSVATTLFTYGKQTGDEKLTERAIELLENLPAETNQTIQRFRDIGVKPGTAGRSQALLQLKKNYCDKKNCLNCAVGAKIIKVV